MSLLAELKRRNVIRVAALYAAVAWLLLQVGDVVIEPLDLPLWTMKLLIVLLVGGFFVAVAMAWAFELTPQGLRRDRGEDVPDGTRPAMGRRGINAAILIAAAALLGYIGVTRWPGGSEAPSQTAAGPRTLAVLPFANLSSNPEDGFFADGLSEELLNLLAHIDGIKVAGRTSSFYFKDRNEDLREIGRQLGVNHILEGSVRRSGTRIRVTAQLISAEDGFHLWSQTYDRELSDILALQDEIGRKVAGALKVTLLGDELASVARSSPTSNPEAYRLYLVARAQVRERGHENLRAALKLFQQARDLDPALAGAHAGEAIALGLLWTNHGEGDPSGSLAVAEAAARRAIAADPDSSDANAALGRTLWVQARMGGVQSPEARQYLERAVTLDPLNSVALYWLGRHQSGDGNPERALQLYDRALEIDPLEFIAGSARAELLSSLGRGPQAIAEFERLIAVYPGNQTLAVNFAGIAMTWGRFTRALALLETTSPADTPIIAAGLQEWIIRWSWGDEAGARQALERVGGNAISDWSRRTALAGMARDYQALHRVDREFAANHGREAPFAARAVAYSSALIGHWELPEELARRHLPQMYADPPVVTSGEVCEAGVLAVVIGQRGDPERARRLAQAGLEAWDRFPLNRSPDGLVCRARLLVAAGRPSEAIDAFGQAVDAGFRMLVSDSAIWLRDDLVLRSLNGDPGYEAQWQRIVDDLARQRAEFEAGKRKAATS